MKKSVIWVPTILTSRTVSQQHPRSATRGRTVEAGLRAGLRRGHSTGVGFLLQNEV